MLRLFGQSTPVGATRWPSSPASARNREAGTITRIPSGTGVSSSARTKRSSTTSPFLTSRIDTLLERLDADAPDGIEEDLVRPCAQLEIGRDDVLDHVGDLRVRHGWPEQRAKL